MVHQVLLSKIYFLKAYVKRTHFYRLTSSLRQFSISKSQTYVNSWQNNSKHTPNVRLCIIAYVSHWCYFYDDWRYFYIYDQWLLNKFMMTDVTFRYTLNLCWIKFKKKSTSSGSVSLNSHPSPVHEMKPWHDLSVRSSSKNCHNWKNTKFVSNHMKSPTFLSLTITWIGPEPVKHGCPLAESPAGKRVPQSDPFSPLLLLLFCSML